MTRKIRKSRTLSYDEGPPVDAASSEEELFSVAIGYARRKMWAAAFITLGMAVGKPMEGHKSYALLMRERAISIGFQALHRAFLELSDLYTDDCA